ncbi:MAG: class I SAM-dependent methyltransferase [Burkholderiaceae bacterium]|nr:class I SAM-dependent methyltransferase [Burkholderiaceae bacterium]
MTIDDANSSARLPAAEWDTGSHEDFFKYYEKQSLSPQTMERFRATTETLLRLFERAGDHRSLDVLDVGCGAGAQGKYWLERGHRYCGIDINLPLINLARERARQQALAARFEVGSATALPFADASMDVCVLPELLEHVKDWQGCVNEAVRVLRPGGLLYINTSSRLCPVQQEFNLPLYSWYPGALKRYFERRAVTDWPAVANYAKYPAVNWFSFFQLRSYLEARGIQSFDRFDIADASGRSIWHRAAIGACRSMGLFRMIGHVMTPYTLLLGRRLG